jgi:hypothetical protein
MRLLVIYEHVLIGANNRIDHRGHNRLGLEK